MKNKLTTDEILQKAEDFLKKENYPLAFKLFQQYLDDDPDFFHHQQLLERIKICTEKLNEERARTLIKKAKKLLKKKKETQALEIFKEAYDLSHDEWIKARIESLQEGKHKTNIRNDAQTAAKNKDFIVAVDLYKQLFEKEKNPQVLIHMLFNLVQTAVSTHEILSLLKKYSDLLSDSSDFSDKQLYELGYIYLKAKNYPEALKFWKKLPIENSDFLEQKNALIYLREKQVFDKFKKTGDFTAVETEVEEFLKSFSSICLADIAKKCKIKRAEVLFKNENYRAALDLLLPFSTSMTFEEVLLYARIYYKIVKHSDDIDALDIVNCCEFSLTVLFNPLISGDYYHSPEEFDKIEKKIIKEIYSLNKKYRSFAFCYIIFRLPVMKELKKTFVSDEEKKLILAPKIAWSMDKCDKIVNILKEKHVTLDKKSLQCLSFFYDSKFQISVHNILAGTENLKSCCHSDQNARSDSFKIASFDMALIAFCEHNNNLFEKYLRKTDDLCYSADIFPLISSVLPAEALTLKGLSAMESILAPWLRKCDNKKVIDMINAYSLRKILIQFEDDSVSPTLLKQKLCNIFGKKNIQSIPEDYLQILEHSEYEQIGRLFGKSKFMQAADIAQKTEFEEVKEFFFDEVDDMMHMTVQLNPEYLHTMAKKLYPYCQIVDPSHEITRELAEI